MVTSSNREIEVHASESVVRSLGAGEDELRFLLVAKLIELGRVSVGRGAELCGIPLATFMEKLGAIGVPVINYGDDELDDELRDV
jgi:predicted HTH domain antitoxin